MHQLTLYCNKESIMFTRYLQTVHGLTLTALIYFISSQLKVSVFIQTVLDHSDNYRR